MVIAVAIPVSSQGTVVLDETFDGAELSETWEWHVPVEGPTYSLTERPGWLRIRSPQGPGGFGHWVGQDRAPLLRASLPEGDWDVEARIGLAESGPDSMFHMGLAVVFNIEELLTIGPFRAPQFGADQPELWIEPTGKGGYRKAGAPVDDVRMKLERRGWRIDTLIQRAGDADWVALDSYWTLDEPTEIGILGKTFGDGQAVALDVDYVRVTSIPGEHVEPPVSATVRIDAGDAAPLDPRRNGQFVELMNDTFYGGFWAEMLQNRKFTGEVAPNGVIEGWEAAGEGTFARDNAIHYVPAQSQRIDAPGGEAVGIVQGGLALAKGVGVEGRVVVRADRDAVPISVSLLREGATIASHDAAVRGPEWETIKFAFDAADAAGMDAIAITTAAPAKLWIGCASLMPDSHVDGFRPEVLALCRKMQIPSLRFPGGNFVSGYHWENGVGPRDRRPPRWDRAWDEWEPNDVGTDELFRLCERLGAEPYVCVNAGEGTPREAAEWVEYVNGSADTPQGKRRARNGHSEPYACPLWSIGNEMYGGWQMGHLDATKYAIRAVEFAEAMRAVDPSIELIVNGVMGPDAWNVTQAQVTGHIVDYLSAHHYTHGSVESSPLEDYAHIVGMPIHIERMLSATHEEVNAHSPRPLPIMLDEWNQWTPMGTQLGYQDFHTLRDGLYAVGVLNSLVRLGEKVPGAHMAITVNVMGAVRTNRTQAVSAPHALAFELHAEHGGELRAACEVESTELALPGAAPMPAVDAAAMMSEDGDELHVILINRHPTAEARVRMDVAGFEGETARTTLLSGPEAESINTFEEPETVKLTRGKLGPRAWEELVVPAHSAMGVTVVE